MRSAPRTGAKRARARLQELKRYARGRQKYREESCERTIASRVEQSVQTQGSHKEHRAAARKRRRRRKHVAPRRKIAGVARRRRATPPPSAAWAIDSSCQKNDDRDEREMLPLIVLVGRRPSTTDMTTYTVPASLGNG